ncbi:MAG: EAL domain-containing protein [Acidimicrobiia bacterium]
MICVSTSIVYVGISNNSKNDIKSSFTKRVEKIREEVGREAIRYQNLVATVGAFFNASDRVSPSEFDLFINGLGTENTYPGVKGIAYAQRMDGSEKAEAIKQTKELGINLNIEPSDLPGEHATLLYINPDNKQVPTGMDAYIVPGGKEGLVKASQTSAVVASSPMSFNVSSKLTNGFVMAYPVTHGAPINVSSNANQKFSGWVFAFIDFSSVLPTLNSLKDIDIRIFDTDTNKNLVLPTTNQKSKYKSTFTFTTGTREYTAVVTPNKKFISSSYDKEKAFRYAFLVANVEFVALLLAILFLMHKVRRRREVNLTFQAGHDSLTGLPNRFYLERWLSEKITAPVHRQPKVAVLFIDLDGFKAINDTLGHQMGDEFLMAIARRLQKEVRGKDVLARLGGDEFIVVLEEVSDEIQATRIAQRLIEVVRFPVMLDSGPVCVSASIGIAIVQLDANSDSSSIIRFADAAMYAAKQDKNERIRVFDHKLKSIVDGRHEVEVSIKGAATRSEIVDVLQPLVNVSDGTTYGYEALCRWSHPVFGILTPDQFLDAAKVTGEIIEIDRWMVNKAFDNAIKLSNTSNRDTRIWVNLSVRHLIQGEFYQHVLKALRNSETTADKLGVEIEEEVFKIDNGLLYPFLSQLRDLGILIALDDFGSEEASLQALKRYPYDVIKLDRSLITDFAQNPSASIVPAVVEIARSSDMTVVASGVETPDQLQKVIDIGCNVVQGYVFSEPKLIDDLIDQEENFHWPLPLGVKRTISRTKSGDNSINSAAREA